MFYVVVFSVFGVPQPFCRSAGLFHLLANGCSTCRDGCHWQSMRGWNRCADKTCFCQKKLWISDWQIQTMCDLSFHVVATEETCKTQMCFLTKWSNIIKYVCVSLKWQWKSRRTRTCFVLRSWQEQKNTYVFSTHNHTMLSKHGCVQNVFFRVFLCFAILHQSA